MELEPKLNATRFAQLQPGDLFICPSWSTDCFALKVVDPAAGADTFFLPLGPKFPADPYQPRLYAEQGTTISFGKGFIFRFRSDPKGWLNSDGQVDYFCAALVDGEVYLRANCDRYAGGYQRCWIKLATGVISYQRLPGIAAYSKTWELLVPQGQFPPKSLLEHTGRPLSAD